MTVGQLTPGDFVPKPVEGLQLSEMEGEAILYWQEKTKMISLNESARVIWQLCDGTRTVSEITSELVASFPEMADEIRAQVPKTIKQFVDEGVLELAGK
jgi:hypothetical protein